MNTKYNPHKRCGCRACRAGAASTAGKYVHRAVNRKYRHADKVALRLDPYGYERAVVSTPYTD